MVPMLIDGRVMTEGEIPATVVFRWAVSVTGPLVQWITVFEKSSRDVERPSQCFPSGCIYAQPSAEDDRMRQPQEENPCIPLGEPVFFSSLLKQRGT